jgi:hypothetical protein
VIGLFLLPYALWAQTISDYLIINNIGTYAISTPQPVFPGEPPIGGPQVSADSDILSGVDHFPDHADKTYKVRYIGENEKPSPKVEVTQHIGGDSDRWLLHEVEDSYRDSDMETLGLLTDGTVMRKVDNNRVLWLGIGGASFTWVSNKVVIKISYTDLKGTKPEPSEVVQAYLAKFPSTITMTDTELKASTHSVQWIKDEMDRRLWLCDKWNAQYQTGQAQLNDLIYNLNRSMGVFLNYREKYFGVSAKADLKALFDYNRNNDLASFQTKLKEYKKWWAKHKDKHIFLR